MALSQASILERCNSKKCYSFYQLHSVIIFWRQLLSVTLNFVFTIALIFYLFVTQIVTVGCHSNY